MTDYRNIQGADGGDPNRYLELLSADFDKKVGDLQQRLKDAMDALKDDASNAETLARYQAALGDYTTMRSAQSAAVKSMKDIAQGTISKF